MEIKYCSIFLKKKTKNKQKTKQLNIKLFVLVNYYFLVLGTYKVAHLSEFRVLQVKHNLKKDLYLNNSEVQENLVERIAQSRRFRVQTLLDIRLASSLSLLLPLSLSPPPLPLSLALLALLMPDKM